MKRVLAMAQEKFKRAVEFVRQCTPGVSTVEIRNSIAT
jgi:hypothetical protein